MGKGWELKEIKTLKQFADKKTCKQIGELLGRTEKSIFNMVRKLGIKKTFINVDFWTPQEIELLIELYPKTISKKLTPLFPNKDIIQISNKACQIGLRKEGRKPKTKRNEKPVDDCRS